MQSTEKQDIVPIMTQDNTNKVEIKDIFRLLLFISAIFSCFTISFVLHKMQRQDRHLVSQLGTTFTEAPIAPFIHEATNSSKKKHYQLLKYRWQRFIKKKLSEESHMDKTRRK